MKKAGVDIESIKKCIQQSILGQDIIMDDNKLLQKERQAWSDNAVAFHPAIVIN